MMGPNDAYESDPMSQIRSSCQSEPRASPENHRNHVINPKGKWNGRSVEKSDARGDMRYANSMLSEEGGTGTSNLSRARNAYPSEMNNMDGLYDVHRIGDDLTEILIKCDELRDQLSRFGYSTGKGKAKAAPGKRMAHQDSRSSSRSWYPGTYPDPPFSSFQPPSSPLMLRQESCHGFNHQHSSGSYMDDASMAYFDSIKPDHRHVNRPYSSGSLFHVPSPVQPPHFQENPAPFGRRGYEFRDVKYSDFDAFTPQEPLPVRPIAGGSPFIVCHNCFELLLLPERVMTKTSSSSQRKIKCGVCSNVVHVFARHETKSAVRSGMEATHTTAFKFDDSGNLSPIREELYKNRDRDTFSSDDYDDVGCDFQPAVREMDEPSSFEGRVKNSSTTKHSDPTSTRAVDMEVREKTKIESSRGSEDVSKEELAAAGKEVKQKEPSSPAGTSLQEHVECSSAGGNSKHEKSLPNKGATRRISFSDLPSGTVTDMASAKSHEKETSFDSGDGVGRKGRTAGSILASFVKRSFKEVKRLNRNVEQEKGNVRVNGHLIPDEMIKQAEKVAGPIGPGSYWYDYGAGFWGVMGGPCLGILPPYIEEFNHPMQEKCAGGDTDILVNGRELNQKDINLLNQRGLPADRNRSYYIDISGRVLDNHTGEELESLGKLAPTIERLQRGFGMRIPKHPPNC